jgi:scyllo-inositol 2-dehydrogenase (NADP+)
MIDLAVAGLGKMGLSHVSIARAHPDVNVVGVCDSAAYVLDIMGKYTGLRTFTDFETMLDETRPDAVVVATPTHLHAAMVHEALARHIAVFCEKPLSLGGEGTALAQVAFERDVVTQVGYHNRYVASFAEVKRLLDLGAIGRVSHAVAEAYGPVVLRAKGGTWRSRRSTGGGCLYDYAAHPLDLLTWYFGPAVGVSSSTLGRIFSKETEDEVYSSVHFARDVSSQLSVNWSDGSQRKMSTSVTIWGSGGRIQADRQEIQVFLSGARSPVEGYRPGWNVKYTTEMTPPTWFYLRGEEYSAQMADFVRRVATHAQDGVNTFRSAAQTDEVIEMILRAAQPRTQTTAGRVASPLGASPLTDDAVSHRSVGRVFRRRR